MKPIGKVAVVTGGSQGIGIEIARKLLTIGMDVLIVARREEALRAACADLEADAQAAGRSVRSFACDVSKSEAVDAAFDHAATEFGVPAQVLVNCAGMGKLHRLLDLSLETWEEVFAVNSTGTFLTTKALSVRLREAQLPGSIINITSLNHDVATAGIAAYCAAKAAATQFTRAAAIELAPYGIRVNSVAPGAVLTPMMEPYLNDEMREGYISHTPLGRLGTEVDIASVVAFLASEESAWIDGASIPVDGGAHLMGLHNYADAAGLP